MGDEMQGRVRLGCMMAAVLAAMVLSGCASRTRFPEGKPAQLVATPHKILVVETYRGWKQFDDPLRAGLEQCGVAAEFMNRENPAGGLFSGIELKNLVTRKASEVAADHVLEVVLTGVTEQTGTVRATTSNFSFILTHMGSGREVWRSFSSTRKTDDLANELLAAMARDGALPSCPTKEARQ